MSPENHPVRRAVIDVGTNSVKLLVAEIANGQVVPIKEKAEQTRLGRSFYLTQRLTATAIADTAAAVKRFAGKANELGCLSVRVIATSAARDAINGEELTTAIRQASGLPPEVISGEQEARWTYLGVHMLPKLVDRPLLLIDVGGGSTEFILGRGDQVTVGQSFQLGTVRLLEALTPEDPPTAHDRERCRLTLEEQFDREIDPVLKPHLDSGLFPGLQCVGTGGTASIIARLHLQLAKFDRDRIEGTRIPRSSLDTLTQKLWRMPLAGRQELIGLPPNRADIILTGMAIYREILCRWELPELWVTTRGLRFAALQVNI